MKKKSNFCKSFLFALACTLIFIFSAAPSAMAQDQKNAQVSPTTQVARPEAGAVQANDAETGKPFQLTWIDIAFINFYPIPSTRMADFSDAMFGFNARFNFMVMQIAPLWLFTGIMLDGNLTNSIRLDRIIDLSLVIGLGWRFTPKPRFSLTPKISYGAMLHFTYGDYYNAPDIYPGDPRAGKKRDHFFSDQIFHYELEFAYDLTPASRVVECEIFLSPGFIHFVEANRQGLELGFQLGVRFKPKALVMPQKQEPVKTQTVVLAGRVIDKETGLELKDAVTMVPDKKVEKAVPVAGESFAFVVEAGKNCTLQVTREGYDPVTHVVEAATLVPDKKATVVIPLPLSRVWGVYGHVYDKETNEPLTGVSVTITDANKKAEEMGTNRSGDFRMQLQPDTDYDILLRKKKYFTIRCGFTTTGKKPGWYDVKEFMKTDFQKVVIGAAIEFGNIYYDSGSWTIRRDSMPGLDRMAQFLTDNPDIVVELGAHTDSLGDATQNLALSQKRAQSAVDYLIGKGIPASRISAMGYGETKLKNRCADGVPCYAKEHQENRRTELVVKDILQ